MARKPRLEFAGAIYHVISRGNYRKALFEGDGAGEFKKTLFQACEKCGWRLHAYVVMSNHYHLALETPEANLVEGMRWLQGTFGIRFNAARRERGYVFQSRYKSLVIEEGSPNRQRTALNHNRHKLLDSRQSVHGTPNPRMQPDPGHVNYRPDPFAAPLPPAGRKR